MWFTYIIYSGRIDRYYVGYTDNLPWRLERHNLGWSRFTKGGIPWELVYFEKFASKQDAIRREKEIKRKKNREYIDYLIKNAE
jgi:putative endonuclease